MPYDTSDLARAWERGRESKPSDVNPYTQPPHTDNPRCRWRLNKSGPQCVLVAGHPGACDTLGTVEPVAMKGGG